MTTPLKPLSLEEIRPAQDIIDLGPPNCFIGIRADPKEGWAWDKEFCERLLHTARLAHQMAEALKFYADKDNWDADEMIPTCWDNGDIDLGRRATEALKAWEGEK